MCLILFSHRQHPRYPFVLAANREEDHCRPTAPMTYWAGKPGLLAGRDLQAGGTWMGLTRTGRFAAVTNFRERTPPKAGLPSRGRLVLDFLRGTDPPSVFLSRLDALAHTYAGYNLLVGDGTTLWYHSNRAPSPVPVPPGCHGLSNHLLDTPWPKVVRGLAAFEALLGAEALAPEPFLSMLRDETAAPDSLLPDTGVGIAWERILSPIFIRSPEYGTRVSTVIIVDGTGEVQVAERSFLPDGSVADTSFFSLRFEQANTV